MHAMPHCAGDEDEDDGTVESLQGRERELFHAPMRTPEADDAQQLANSPVLHIALSARMGLDPSEMAQHRSDLFPASGETTAMACLLALQMRIALRWCQFGHHMQGGGRKSSLWPIIKHCW